MPSTLALADGRAWPRVPPAPRLDLREPRAGRARYDNASRVRRMTAARG
ncbi:MAG: hypothetical protein SCH68_09960 [Brevefilum sp.]|nr:hypothetical protein [Brevefilum sp.]